MNAFQATVEVALIVNVSLPDQVLQNSSTAMDYVASAVNNTMQKLNVYPCERHQEKPVSM